MAEKYDEYDEYAFPDDPDGNKVEPTPEFEVEVIDDTPPQDKGREPMPIKIVEELEKDDLEEYSDKVKTRMAQMKKVWHDERREKEAATREREEALRLTQAYASENKQLKQRLGQGERLFVDEVTKSANTELASAKDRLKQAYESGDSSLIADAQEAMTDAKLKLRDYQNYRPSLQTDTSGSLPYYATSSYWSPYVTTVGLYDEAQNLLAIGKLSQPLPTSPTTDTTILVNIDM